MIHNPQALLKVLPNATLNFILLAAVLGLISCFILTQIKHNKLDHGSLKAPWIKCSRVIQLLVIIPFVFEYFRWFVVH